MTAPTTDRLQRIDTELTRLSHTLAGARAAHAHSPNSDTEGALDRVRGQVDRYLDQRLDYAARTEGHP